MILDYLDDISYLSISHWGYNEIPLITATLIESEWENFWDLSILSSY